MNSWTPTTYQTKNWAACGINRAVTAFLRTTPVIDAVQLGGFDQGVRDAGSFTTLVPHDQKIFASRPESPSQPILP